MGALRIALGDELDEVAEDAGAPLSVLLWTGAAMLLASARR